MKKLLAPLLAFSLFASAQVAAQGAEPIRAVPASVTLTVTDFPDCIGSDGLPYVEASMALARHPDVRMTDRDGLATLVVKRAVKIDVSVVSADPDESYKPLGIVFVQYPNAAGGLTDPDGTRNFTVSSRPGGVWEILDHAIDRGDNGRFEFLVVVQRASDGAIGVIDPGIETEAAN